MASTRETYGEQMLARAEVRARAVAARRRRLTLLIPTLVATLWSLVDLFAARHARLSLTDAGFLGHVADHAQPILWTVLFVVVPMLLAVKPSPWPAGAAIAFVAGPILTPLLFHAGGWNLWQTAILTVVAGLIVMAARPRASSTAPRR